MRCAPVALVASSLALLTHAGPADAVELARGDILVANGHGGIVVHIDPLTGDQKRTTTSIVIGRDPWGLAFDPVRRVVYKGDDLVPELFREDLETGIQTAISRSRGVVLRGSGPAFIAPLDVLVEPDGTLVVADLGMAALVAVDPDSGSRAILSSSGVGSVGSGPFLGPGALARDADGSLLALNTLASSRGVLRVARDTGDRSVVSSNSVGSGPAFVTPRGIAVGPEGTIFVADASSDHVLAIDPATGNRSVFSSEAVGTGPALMNPADLSIDAGGDLLVFDSASASLLRIDRTSGDRTVVASPSVGSGPNLFAQAMAVEATGSVLLVSLAGDLWRVDAATGDRVLLASREIGSGPDFQSARGVAVEAAGGTAVAVDATLDAVLRVELATGDRTPVSATPPLGWEPIGSGPDLGQPLHLRVEPGGTLLVSDAGVLASGSDRGILRVWPETGDRQPISNAAIGSGPTWSSPQDLELTTDGRLFVVDSGLDAVLEVDPESGDRSLVTGQGVGSGPALSLPIGIAAEADGRLLVVDQTLQAVLRIDVDTGARTLVSGAGAGSGPAFSLPTEIALEAEGSILVSDPGLNAVLRVHPVSGIRLVVSPTNGLEWLDVVRGIAVVGPPASAVPTLALSSRLLVALVILTVAFLRMPVGSRLRARGARSL